MRAIILAAGRGSRFGSYTNGGPKCLLEIDGISLIERQIETFRRLGIHDIVVVKGFAAEKISIEGVRYYIDAENCYNMVYSLFCAEPEIHGDIIISYADIIFEDSVLQGLLEALSHDITVAVDILWEEYYKERFGEPFKEAESLIYDGDGCILEIGESNPKPLDVQAQYIGLIKLSNNGCKIFCKKYHDAKDEYWNKHWIRGRTFKKAYMTDFLQYLIDLGALVHAFPIKHGWLEFDSVDDYQKALSWLDQGVLDRFCSLNP